MKKITVFLLLAAIVLSFAACSENSLQKEQKQASVNVTEKQDMFDFTSTKWIDVYLGYVLRLNENNNARIKDDFGSWLLEENTLTVDFYTETLKGTEREILSFDVVEENGVTLLKSDGKSNYLGGKSVFCPADKVDEIRKSLVKDKNKKVSTDIIEFSINNAELGYSTQPPKCNVDTDNMFEEVVTNLEEAFLPAENGFYNTNRGTILLCHDFTIKNIDRQYINASKYYDFYVRYNDEVYHVDSNGIHSKDGSGSLDSSSNCIQSTNGNIFVRDFFHGMRLDPDSSMEIRRVGICSFEPENLTDSFELIVSLENSSGENEFFIYSVN